MSIEDELKKYEFLSSIAGVKSFGIVLKNSEYLLKIDTELGDSLNLSLNGLTKEAVYDSYKDYTNSNTTRKKTDIIQSMSDLF
jgi:hypothetical protein